MRVDLTAQELDALKEAVKYSMFETSNEMKSIESEARPLSDLEAHYYETAEREYSRLSSLAQKLKEVKE